MPIGSGNGWGKIPVSSQSIEGVIHEVLFPPWDEDPICDCKGYRFRGTCSHQDIAKQRRKEMSKVKKATIDQQIESAETTAEKLQILTKDLGKQYAAWKKAEEGKDKRKEGFFNLLTDFIQQSVPLERTTERVILKNNETIEDALKTRYPDMVVALDSDGEAMMEENPDNDREWIVVLNQDPKFMKYQFVNEDDGMVYGRGRTERGASFDTNGFVEEFPELAERCVERVVTLTVPPHADLSSMDTSELLSLSSEVFILDEEKAEALIVAEPSLLATFMKFRVAPKISMTLLKPRKAKADEL